MSLQDRIKESVSRFAHELLVKSTNIASDYAEAEELTDYLKENFPAFRDNAESFCQEIPAVRMTFDVMVVGDNLGKKAFFELTPVDLSRIREAIATRQRETEPDGDEED